jgi:hypothetical protein
MPAEERPITFNRLDPGTAPRIEQREDVILAPMRLEREAMELALCRLRRRRPQFQKRDKAFAIALIFDRQTNVIIEPFKCPYTFEFKRVPICIELDIFAAFSNRHEACRLVE